MGLVFHYAVGVVWKEIGHPPKDCNVLIKSPCLDKAHIWYCCSSFYIPIVMIILTNHNCTMFYPNWLFFASVSLSGIFRDKHMCQKTDPGKLWITWDAKDTYALRCCHHSQCSFCWWLPRSSCHSCIWKWMLANGGKQADLMLSFLALRQLLRVFVIMDPNDEAIFSCAAPHLRNFPRP